MSDEVKMSKVLVDGVEYQMRTGANLLSELLKLGRDNDRYPDQLDHGSHYVPHYCWHPGLSVSGNCRMCFIEITSEMRRGDQVVKSTMPTTACTNVVRDGIEVSTRNDNVRKVQNGVQEFLLINHPLDCPECDKSGECRLQDYAFDFGRGYTRFEERKVASHIKQLGPTIDFWGTRCIQCSRCVRFSDEISGKSELALVNRGDRTTIDTFPGIPIDNGIDLNVVQICPVGALKNHDFLYQSRVWSLAEKSSLCGLCAKGCNVRYDSLKGVVKRVMAEENRAVNGWWICNEGRLNFEWINRLDRLLQPVTKDGEEQSWSDVYVSLTERLRTHLDQEPGSLAVVLNASQTLEELYLMRELFRDVLKVETFGAVARPDLEITETYLNFTQSTDGNPNRRGLELVFGIEDAAASLDQLVHKLEAREIKTLWVVNNSWDGWLPPQLTSAMNKAEMVVGMGLFNDDFARRCDYTLAMRSFVEKDGSFINDQWRLQSFRKALDPVGGLADTEVLQEFLDRLVDPDVQSPVLSVASVFGKVAESIPQLAGYTHRQVLRQGGVPLM